MIHPDDPINPTPVTGDHNGIYPASKLGDAKPGISKREYFAAMAMQGIIAQVSGSKESRDKYTVNAGYVFPAGVVVEAVTIADALILELNNRIPIYNPHDHASSSPTDASK